eukprot:107211_1
MCNLTWKILQMSLGTLGFIILPLAVWCLHQHIRYQKKNVSPKKLYRLSIAVYICTIIGSISAVVQGFTWCSDLSSWIPFLSWVLQQIAWTSQWIFLIGLLFSRVHIVFKGSVYALSKPTIVSFSIIYFIFIGSIVFGFFAMFSGLTFLFFVSYFLGLASGLIMAIYLPILFIYKLVQINKRTIKNNTEFSGSSSPTSCSSSVKSTSNHSKRNVSRMDKKKDAFSSIIRKCVILTIISLISTWTVFVCVVMSFSGISGTGLWIIWTIALIGDIYTNFCCVMLTNSFCGKYYGYLC